MEKEIIELVKQLMDMDSLHQEYQDNEILCTLDFLKKDKNTLVLTVSLKENKDKKEFEKWANNMDDDFFNEVWESLSQKYDIKKLNDEYNTGNCNHVIGLFKQQAKNLAKQKILELQKLIGD